jgi:two-component system cell cycle response regulator CpdR
MAHILLAEDDDSMRQFLTLALERAGHSVMAKKDGIEALEALDDKEAGYALLLTDIVMPGMDGIELAQRATEKCPTLKVMFITGFAAVAMSANNAGQTKARVLSKPFHLNDLVSQVETLLAA